MLVVWVQHSWLVLVNRVGIQVSHNCSPAIFFLPGFVMSCIASLWGRRLVHGKASCRLASCFLVSSSFSKKVGFDAWRHYLRMRTLGSILCDFRLTGGVTVYRIRPEQTQRCSCKASGALLCPKQLHSAGCLLFARPSTGHWHHT